MRSVQCAIKLRQADLHFIRLFQCCLRQGIKMPSTSYIRLATWLETTIATPTSPSPSTSRQRQRLRLRRRLRVRQSPAWLNYSEWGRLACKCEACGCHKRCKEAHDMTVYGYYKVFIRRATPTAPGGAINQCAMRVVELSYHCMYRHTHMYICISWMHTSVSVCVWVFA